MGTINSGVMQGSAPHLARLSSTLLLCFLSTSAATQGFAGPIQVHWAAPRFSIAGSTTGPGTVKCLIVSANTTQLGGFLLTVVAAASLPASVFWSDGVTSLIKNSVALITRVDSPQFSFDFEIDGLDDGSLYMVSCASTLNQTEQNSPIFATPAVSLRGTPGTTCAAALNPITQSSYPDYPWSKMTQFTSAYLGVNDLGQYDNCLAQQNATYCSLGVPLLGARAVGGYCLPDLCDSANLGEALASAAKQNIASQLSNALASLASASADASEDSPNAADELTAQLDIEVQVATYAPDGLFLCAGEEPDYPPEIWFWATPLMLLVTVIFVATFAHINSLSREVEEGSDGIDKEPVAQEQQQLSCVVWLSERLSLMTSWNALVEQRPGNLQVPAPAFSLLSQCALLGGCVVYSVSALCLSDSARCLSYSVPHLLSAFALCFCLRFLLSASARCLSYSVLSASALVQSHFLHCFRVTHPRALHYSSSMEFASSPVPGWCSGTSK